MPSLTERTDHRLVADATVLGRAAARSASAGHVSVFVVASARLYAEGLCRLLAEYDAIDLVGAAVGGEDVPAMIATLAPRIVLVEASLVRGTGIVRRIAAASACSAIIACGIENAPDRVLECAEAGVDGYVLDTASVDELVRTIDSVDRGELPCSPRIASIVFRHVAALASTRSPLPFATLTVREQQIVALIGQGQSNKEIARALSIEIATVKSHVHHILEKLGVSRRAAVLARLSADGVRPVSPNES